MTRMSAVLAALVLALSTGVSVIAQQATGARASQAKSNTGEDTAAVAAGWAALGAGDAAKASALASAALTANPRSPVAGALLIEAEIARAGSNAGLQAYDRWLGTRRLEDGYLLRRVARAILWETAASPEVGVDALQHLAADDDPQAHARLATMMLANDLAGTRALARIGDQGAITRLIAQMQKQTAGSKSFYIEALIQSRSPLAIPVLTAVLDDVNRPPDVAAAADGLGKLGATGSLPQLRKLFADQSFPYRSVVAGALFRLNDVSGLALLQSQLTSEHPRLRANAAEAMAASPDGNWQQVVRGLVGDPDPVNRLTAAKLLAPYELDLARATLESLLNDENPAVRQNAAGAIAERTAVDFGTLRQLLRLPDATARVRAAGRVLELTR